MLLELLRKNGNRCPVLLASSIQASLSRRYAGSAYGQSKKAAEELLLSYSRETGTDGLIYRAAESVRQVVPAQLQFRGGDLLP